MFVILIFRDTNDERLPSASQMMINHADLYTSSVYNLMYYPLNHKFVAPTNMVRFLFQLVIIILG